jgi:hypothetical protein
MEHPINRDDIVAEDYRERIIVDPDNPILAFKANRDRYTNLPRQKQYAGRPYLGSKQSEDALTWNVFRTLQEARRLDIVGDRLGIGQPHGLLLWTLAPEIDDINAELQYVTGSLIRKFDGIFRGQMTEPDVIVLGTNGIAVIECKLSEPDRAVSHLWEGSVASVEKRLPIYKEKNPNLINKTIDSNDIAPVYQLVRMAFYAMELGASFRVKPLVISLANERNWTKEIKKLYKSAFELWEMFCNSILGRGSPRCESLTWQDLREIIEGTSLHNLSAYLSTHRCL